MSVVKCFVLLPTTLPPKDNRQHDQRPDRGRDHRLVHILARNTHHWAITRSATACCSAFVGHVTRGNVPVAVSIPMITSVPTVAAIASFTSSRRSSSGT